MGDAAAAFLSYSVLKCNLGLAVMPLIPPNFENLKAHNSLKSVMG